MKLIEHGQIPFQYTYLTPLKDNLENRPSDQRPLVGKSKVLSIARDLASVMGCDKLTPHVLGKYRAGDIRHCFADISRSRLELGFEPQVDFRKGLEELAGWLAGQVAVDTVDQAREELENRGLVA